MMLTRSQIRRVVVSTLAAIMLATIVIPSQVLALPAAGAARTAALRSLVLHRNDLPASFGTSITESGLTIDNQNEAIYLHTTAATLAQHGRTTGYQSNLGSKDPTHYFALLDTVDRYRSAAGAHWQWQRDKSLHPAPPSARRLNTSGIGDQAWGFSEFGVRGGTAGVYFRRGHCWARVYVLTFSTVSIGDILRLARTVDSRIQHAG